MPASITTQNLKKTPCALEVSFFHSLTASLVCLGVCSFWYVWYKLEVDKLRLPPTLGGHKHGDIKLLQNFSVFNISLHYKYKLGWHKLKTDITFRLKYTYFSRLPFYLLGVIKSDFGQILWDYLVTKCSFCHNQFL